MFIVHIIAQGVYKINKNILLNGEHAHNYSFSIDIKYKQILYENKK
jgi:hypothetical protein